MLIELIVSFLYNLLFFRIGFIGF